MSPHSGPYPTSHRFCLPTQCQRHSLVRLLQFSHTPLIFPPHLIAPRGLCCQIIARVDPENAIIILASALVIQSSSVIFAVRSTDIGKNTLSRCLGHLPLTSPTSQGAELCRYMMQPLEKIQSPRVSHSQRPIHTDFRDVVVSSRNASTTCETNALLQRLMISSLHNTFKTADPPDPILSAAQSPPLALTSDTATPTDLGIENVIGLLYSQPTAGLPPHGLTMFPGY